MCRKGGHSYAGFHAGWQLAMHNISRSAQIVQSAAPGVCVVSCVGSSYSNIVSFKKKKVSTKETNIYIYIYIYIV